MGKVLAEIMEAQPIVQIGYKYWIFTCKSACNDTCLLVAKLQLWVPSAVGM